MDDCSEYRFPRNNVDKTLPAKVGGQLICNMQHPLAPAPLYCFIHMFCALSLSLWIKLPFLKSLYMQILPYVSCKERVFKNLIMNLDQT